MTTLVHTITVERATTIIAANGAPLNAWSPVVVLRAEIRERATKEVVGDQGARAEAGVAFRTRYVPGITLADRISFGGRAFNLVEVTPVGRDRWLDLRAVATEF